MAGVTKCHDKMADLTKCHDKMAGHDKMAYMAISTYIHISMGPSCAIFRRAQREDTSKGGIFIQGHRGVSGAVRITIGFGTRGGLVCQVRPLWLTYAAVGVF